jgi:hypothetical protein
MAFPAITKRMFVLIFIHIRQRLSYLTYHQDLAVYHNCTNIHMNRQHLRQKKTIKWSCIISSFFQARFWIEGVLLLSLGLLGLFGNLLTLAVLSRSLNKTEIMITNFFLCYLILDDGKVYFSWNWFSDMKALFDTPPAPPTTFDAQCHIIKIFVTWVTHETCVTHATAMACVTLWHNVTLKPRKVQECKKMHKI